MIDDDDFVTWVGAMPERIRRSLAASEVPEVIHASVLALIDEAVAKTRESEECGRRALRCMHQAIGLVEEFIEPGCGE